MPNVANAERIDETIRNFPAKFSRRVLDEIALILDGFPDVRKLFDPFAGVGGIHGLRALGYETWGIELEPEWARCSPYTMRGNALHPCGRAAIARKAPFDAIVFSPSYGNRMADHHTATDASTRNTYTHRLRETTGDETRTLHADNSASMQWGEEYRDFHRRVYAKLYPFTMLREGGLWIINVSDHVRGGERQKVSGFHLDAILNLHGPHSRMKLLDVTPVGTPRNRHGANAGLRVDAELVATFQKQ